MGENINLNDLNKGSWQNFSFEKIAQKISATVQPSKAEVEVYVGLEHIEGNDIHIRRKGIPGEVKGGKLRCSPGDVIFGKRRAYQRKAAIVDFEGICSAHAFVFRAIPEVIEPQLFPFFLHSDQFMNRMVDISVGGLSPTINWGDLKHQEFLLPPKAQQTEIAELLWEMDEAVQKELKALKSLQQYSKCCHYNRVSRDKLNGSNLKTYNLSELGETFTSLSGKSKNDFGEGAPFIEYMNILKNSKINPAEFGRVRIKDGERQNSLKYGDILITGSSETIEEAGMSSVVLDDLQGFFLNSFCFGFRLNDFKTLLPEYARFLMRGPQVRQFMQKHAQGSTRFNISKTTVLNKLQLMLPDLNQQREIVNELEQNEKCISDMKKKLLASKALQKSLINEIF